MKPPKLTGAVLTILATAACGRAGSAEPKRVPLNEPETEASSMKNRPVSVQDDVNSSVTMSEADWKAKLTPEQYRVLRKKGTERAFTGEYWDTKEAGTFRCAGCDAPLFASDHKYDSGTGWPSYTQPVAPGALATEPDNTLFTSRTEVLCARCGGHLGHVFDDGPSPTGKRYCINSAALKLVPRSD